MTTAAAATVENGDIFTTNTTLAVVIQTLSHCKT